MPKLNDLTNKRYGRLTVTERAESRNERTYWKCVCDCGNEVEVRGDTLGVNANSCGCLKKEQDKENLGRFLHGESHSRLANIWYHMISRCYNEKQNYYDSYGGRGIKVCDEWRSDFLVFKQWAMKKGYEENLTIDRINVDGDYEPDNCRWIPFNKQSNNKRGTLWIQYENQWLSLKESYKKEKPSVSYNTVRKRYHQGIREIDELFADRKY